MERSEVSEIPSPSKEMSFTAEATASEMRRHVGRVVALAPEDQDGVRASRKAALVFAANVLRLPFSRVKALFYGEARRIEAHEADQVRAYVYAAQKLIRARADYEQTRAEFLKDASPLMASMAPPALVGRDGMGAAPQEVTAGAPDDRRRA